MTARNPDFDPTLLTAYLDGELDAESAAAVEVDLGHDAALGAELAELAEVRNLVRALPVLALPATAVEVPSLRARRNVARRATVGLAGAAAAAAVLVAFVIPAPSSPRPALVADVRAHRAGTAASEPVSGLAPLATALRVGR